MTTLPLGLDSLGLKRTFHNVGSQGLVHWDRFACDNHNSVVLGRSGSGKSHLVKLETLRSLYRDIQASVIDPEYEYARLAAQVGGAYVHLGADGVRLNPFDLPIHTTAAGRRTAPQDAPNRRALFLQTVPAVCLGAELSAGERAVLDTAIAATYAAAGITTNPRTWTRRAPLMRDLRDTLAAAADGASLARTGKDVQGALSAELPADRIKLAGLAGAQVVTARAGDEDRHHSPDS